MKFLLWIKSLVLEYKAIAIGIAVIFSIGLGGILISPSSIEKESPKTLGQKTKNKKATTDEDTVSTLDAITPTGTKSNTQSPAKTPTPTKKPAISQNVSATNTPTPIPPTQTPPASPNYVINGVTFSSQHPTVTLKPGEQKTLFTMTASGNKNFNVYDFRLIGSTGLGLTEMSGSIASGQTKEIVLKANSDATPGTYSGFIGVTIDGIFSDQKLLPTVIVEGTNQNGQSLNLTGPTAGSFNQGDPITITWEATNIYGDFSLSIQGNNGDTYSFANVANNQRSYTWTAQKSFAPNATHFRFTITGGTLSDHSDGDIIIN